MKCKNVDCENETNGKNVYCSLKCRNIYVNKHLRNYEKVVNTNKIKRDNAEIEYLLNPRICRFCGENIPFEKRLDNFDFCNHSCSAKFNNKLRKGIKHKKYNLSEEGRKKILASVYNRKYVDKYEFERYEYYKNPNKCINCNKILEFKYRNRINCNLKCKKEYHTKNKEEFDLYKALSKFNFNLSDYNEEFDFSLIEKYGWYKAKNNGDNVDGVSRDHMFSIKEGFRRLINPLLLAHPANCELIVNKHNQSKSDDCSLSIETLLQRIEQFEVKYGKYHQEDVKTYIELSELNSIYLGKLI
jgi:hypothetical protein